MDVLGKSTLVGHLLYQCGAVDVRTIQRYEREAAAAAGGRGHDDQRHQQHQQYVKYAWILDTLHVAVGDRVTLAPTGVLVHTGTVQSIEIHHLTVDRATAGDNVGLCLKGVVARHIKRGHVLSLVDGAGAADDGGGNDQASSSLAVTATAVESFVAQVNFLDHATVKVTVGYRPMLDVHTAHVSCEFTRLVTQIDSQTGDVIDDHPTVLRGGDAAIVELRPITPLSLEAFADFASLGRFCIRGDDKHVVAVGVVNSIVRATTTTAAVSAAPVNASDEEDDDDDDESSDDDDDDSD
jgi:translation elongation factor EF-1alpha